MSKEDLRATLERLRTEVDGLSFRNPRDRERMHALVAGIERQLKNSHDEERGELLDQIPGVIKQLEVEHPTVTAILSRVISALSSMGI